ARRCAARLRPARRSRAAQRRARALPRCEGRSMTAAGSDTARPRRRRGWRIATRIVLALVLLVLLARLALPFVLPSIVDAAAAGRGLAARYERLEQSLLGGELRLAGLQLAPRAADGTDEDRVFAEPSVELANAQLDVNVSALGSGELRVHRAEIDGLDLRIERDADGRVAWLEGLAAAPGDGAREAEAAEEPDAA